MLLTAMNEYYLQQETPRKLLKQRKASRKERKMKEKITGKRKNYMVSI